MSAALAAVVTALETAAGASTNANPSPAGYWKRIAAASETLAGATSTANDTRSGSMLRAAVALESIAGTSGAEENAAPTGYLKRIVDALEAQAGAVTVGSLEGRLVVAALAATFSVEPGPNLWPDEMLTGAGGLYTNIGAWTFSGGAASSNFEADFLTATSLEALTAGTYRVTWTPDLSNGGNPRLRFGGTFFTLLVGVPGEPQETEIVLVAPSNNNISLIDPNGDGLVLAAPFQINKIA